MNKQTIKEITFNDKIQFDALHPSYGRAEFIICPVFKYGYMKELYIQPIQQERNDGIQSWVIKIGSEFRLTTFSIRGWVHRGQEPRIWRQWYCKEHNTIAHEFYVPDGTDTLRFSLHFGNSVDIILDKDMVE